MKINQAGINLIKKFEGLSLEPYFCSAGVKTIGIGHAILPTESFTKITEQQAEDILRKDIAKFEDIVSKLVTVNLDDNQFSALVCFTFNVGAGNLASSTLLKKVNAKEFLDVPNEFIRWRNANNKPFKGLLKRRLEEALLFMQY